jgi:hypothetical protein
MGYKRIFIFNIFLISIYDLNDNESNSYNQKLQ